MCNRRRTIARANRMARELRAENCPTNTSLAYAFWELLSSNSSPISWDEGRKLYLKAGYQPFMGYPLTHKQNWGK